MPTVPDASISGAQVEWDDDTCLYMPYEVEQLLMPDCSNCLAVRSYLKMLGVNFALCCRPNAEFMSPTGKVPFVKSGQYVIAELDFIIDFAASKGHSLSENLEKSQRDDMRAYMSLVNTVLGNAETYLVWCDPATLPITVQRYGSVYPFPLNHWVTFLKKRSTLSRLDAVGWLKKSIDEVYKEVDTCCKALSDRLGDKEYFFDNQPTELDALVFGHVFTILTTALPTNRLAATVRGYSNLIKLCTNIEKLHFSFHRELEWRHYEMNEQQEKRSPTAVPAL
ncbi:metaxin-2 isoform X2 [Planococcus citri]|uniref:metaxin-2 isoform X2 n=1 Tax=Planococcus citri TaxID=170843 RepID=UPI0031F8142E